MPDETQERLQKILAGAGIASRRGAEEMILEGRVTVNGRVVTRLGTKADPGRDDIRVDGQRIGTGVTHVYAMLNKPRGVLSTMEDDPEHPTLNHYVTLPQRLYPVGRLDVTSEGLILLTDDGELANRLTHPRYEHEKEYRVTVNGRPTDETLDVWRRGVVLDGRRTAPAHVDLLRVGKEGSLLRVVMREGRKRQIRRVAALLGHPVRQLVRVRLGPLELGTLEPGQWRYLTEKEIGELTAVKEGRSPERSKRDRRAARRQGAPGDREDRPRSARDQRKGIPDGQEDRPRARPARRQGTPGEREDRPGGSGAGRRSIRDEPEERARGTYARREGTEDNRQDRAHGRPARRQGTSSEREDRPHGRPARRRRVPDEGDERPRGAPTRRRSTGKDR